MSAAAEQPAARKKAVRPRDAASLVLLRQGRAGTEVLMGKRATRHKFLPDVYVFPGGRVDARDTHVKPLRPLPAAVNAAIASTCSPARAQALAVAAVRETLEETGLVLGELAGEVFRPDLGGLRYLARAITPSASPIRFHARFLLADAAGAKGELGGSGELLDLAWRTLEQSMRLPLADITEFLLGELQRRVIADDWSGPVPFWGYRRGIARVRHS